VSACGQGAVRACRRRLLPRRRLRALVPVVLAAVVGACASPQLAPSGPSRLTPKLIAADTARMPDGFRLPLRAWGPARADSVVLGLHGFNDYGEAIRPLAERLAADGHRVYAVDQRGFGAGLLAGRWHGSARLTADLRALMSALRERHPGARLVLIGESMGGAVILAALADAPLPADGLVLIAPAVWSRDSMPWYQRTALALSVRVAPGKVLTGEGVPIHPSDNLDMLRAMGMDPLVLKGARVDALWGVTNLMDRAAAGVGRLQGPALLLYGERDRIIPPAAFCRVLQRLPGDHVGLRVVLYEHGWHMLPRDRQGARVRHDIAEWLRRPAAPLPSGEEAPAGGERLRAFCDDAG
jgi:acylglycerol lipase